MNLFKWIVDSNFWISFGSVGLALFTFSIFQYPPIPSVLYFLFLATLLTYNLQVLIKWKSRENQFKEDFLVSKNIVIASVIVASGALLFIIPSLQTRDLMFFSFLATISFLYAFELYWTKKKKVNLRSIPYLKIYLVTIVWVGSCILFPIIKMDLAINHNNLLIITSFIFYLIAITIPFDIRDLKFDSGKMKTIPQIAGVKSAKLISITLLLFASICLLIVHLFGSLKIDQLILAIGIHIYCVLLVIYTNESRSKYYYSAFIDGSMVLFAISYFL